jgi:hypothetical protein
MVERVFESPMHPISVKLYDRLPSESHFRLLEILPSSHRPIDCTLRICSIQNAADLYEALSYTWALDSEFSSPFSSDNSWPINCNGIRVDVKKNLFNALSALRRSSSSRFIWADAICINQADKSERSQQVRLMGDIFRNAFRVLVWLGLDNHRYLAPKAFAGVCAVVNTWSKEFSSDKDPSQIKPYFSSLERCRVSQIWDSSYLGQHDLLQILPYFSHLERHDVLDDTLTPDDTRWEFIMALYERKWFTRMWVVQEIALARRATVIWDRWEISWEWVGLAAAVIRTNWNRIITPGYYGRVHRPSSRQIPIGVMNAYFMFRISRSQQYLTPLKFSFRDFLVLTGQFDCTDERDKIFGLLGLPTTDDTTSRLTPDYSKNLPDLYREVTEAMLCSSSSLNFLSHIHWQTGSYPSWIPQWSIRRPQSLAPLEPHPNFAASLSAQSIIKRMPSSSSDRLIVRGILVGTVSSKEAAGHLERMWRTGWELSGRMKCNISDRFLIHPKVEEEDIFRHLQILLQKFGWTEQGLEILALTLTAGKTWYGTPVQDRKAHLSDFSKCLLTEGLWWALRREPAHASSGSSLAMNELAKLSVGGNPDRFMDAVATTNNGRLFFTIGNGKMYGVGPVAMKEGDIVCVIYGTAMPLILRRCEEKLGYSALGPCYVYELMHGEAVRDLRDPANTYKETWIELV